MADPNSAFDTDRCAIEAIERIPCENMLVNENVADAPPAIPDCAPSLPQANDDPPCPTLTPSGAIQEASVTPKLSPGLAIQYRFVRADTCAYDLEITAQYLSGDTGTSIAMKPRNDVTVPLTLATVNTIRYRFDKSGPNEYTLVAGGTYACVEMQPQIEQSVAMTPVTTQPRLYWEFVRIDDCAYELLLDAEYYWPGSQSLSESCVRLYPDSIEEVTLTPTEEDPRFFFKFVRRNDGCAYDLEIEGEYYKVDGLTTSQTVITDVYCQDGEIVGVPVVMVFSKGVLIRIDT